MKVPKRENKAVLICPYCSKDIVNTEDLDKVMKAIIRANNEAIFKELNKIWIFDNHITDVKYNNIRKKWLGE